MRKWNVVIEAGGTESKIVARGETLLEARRSVFEKYKGVTKIISIVERDMNHKYPVSMEALRDKRYVVKKGRKKKFFG